MRVRLVLGVVMVLAVVACNGDTETTGDTDAQPADGEWVPAGISKVQTADGFEVTLEVEDLELEPGTPSRARLTITNVGDQTLYTVFLGTPNLPPAARVEVADASGSPVVKYAHGLFDRYQTYYHGGEVEGPFEEPLYYLCTFDFFTVSAPAVGEPRDELLPGSRQVLEFQICVDYWKPVSEQDLIVVGRGGYALERGIRTDGLSLSVEAQLPVRYTDPPTGE